MSMQNVEVILGKLVTDQEFRKLLSENPDQALSGYELTDEEKEALRTIDSEKLTALSESLDQRITKAFTNIG